ncbi:MAG: mechanosensitive ion channel family protein [Dehalogenimonas sp.]
MLNKIVKLVILLALIAVLAGGVIAYGDNVYLSKALYSAIALAALYLVFKFLFEEAVASRISDPVTKYSFRRALSIFFFIGAGVALTNIWVDAQNLVVAFGLIGAGVALALQDLFRNIAGGLLIIVRGNYRVGDRIEINSRKGDVIDIDLLNTTLLEIGEWVSGDQPTGRLCIIPNGLILSHPLHNYTKDHRFIWDEITVPLTHSSDWKLASEAILDLATELTMEATDLAQKSISRLSAKYYLPERAVAPKSFISPNDNWIDLTIRYVTDVRDRRQTKDKLNRLILLEFGKLGAEKVEIASETMSVTLFGNEHGGQAKQKGGLP